MDANFDAQANRERFAELEHRRLRYEAGLTNTPIIGDPFYRGELVSREKVPDEVQKLLKAATNDSFEIIHDEYSKVDGINGVGPSFHIVRVVKRGASPSGDLLMHQNISIQWENLNDNNRPWPMGRPAEPTKAFVERLLPNLVKHFVGPVDRYKELRAEQKKRKQFRHVANRARIAKKGHQLDLQIMEQALPYLSSKKWEGGKGRKLPNDWNKPFRKTREKPLAFQITVPEMNLELV